MDQVQAQAPGPEALKALVRYSCYQRVVQMVRSCQRLAATAERQEAFAKVEQAVLHLMDEEWPCLVMEEQGFPTGFPHQVKSRLPVTAQASSG